MVNMPWERTGTDLILRVHVQPGASRTDIAGLHGDALKIRLQAPPVDGKANEALCAFLAAEFGVRRQDVSLLSGDSNRRKRIIIRRAPEVPARIISILQGTVS